MSNYVERRVRPGGSHDLSFYFVLFPFELLLHLYSISFSFALLLSPLAFFSTPFFWDCLFGVPYGLVGWLNSVTFCSLLA
jgi:hypothetical protein